MTRRTQEINLQLNQLADAVLLVASMWIAHVLRNLAAFYIDGLVTVPPFDRFLWLLWIIAPFGPLLLEAQGFYRYPFQATVVRSLSQIGRAGVWLGLLIAGCVIFFRLEVPSRAVFLIFGAIGTILMIVRQQLLLVWLRRRGRQENFREKVLLAGLPFDMRQLLDRLTSEHSYQMEVVDQIDIEKQPLSDLVDALHQHSVSRVIFASGHLHLNRVQEAIAACETEGVESWLLADFIRTSIAKPAFDVFAEQPMLVFRTTPDISWALMTKKVVDFCGAMVGVVVLSPLLLLIAIAIRLTSHGPALFRQMRGGKHGRPFSMFKFRSMYLDAEERKAGLAGSNKMSGPVFKVENDPRVTPLGRFLRKYSLDELPQLFNVLKGQMSLVGPRPLPLYEVALFESAGQRRRLSVRPGLTCLWQISGRNHVTSFQDWVRLDLEYIDNWSLWLDVKIIFRTIPAVLTGRGAE